MVVEELSTLPLRDSEQTAFCTALQESELRYEADKRNRPNNRCKSTAKGKATGILAPLQHFKLVALLSTLINDYKSTGVLEVVTQTRGMLQVQPGLQQAFRGLRA